MQDTNDWVELGRTGGAYGVRGWVRVVPFESGEALEKTKRWRYLSRTGEEKVFAVTGCRRHGGALVAKFEGVETKEDADALHGTLFASRADFPSAGKGAYWACDIVGCEVVNREGVTLGRITDLGDNGVQDLFVVEYESDGKTQSFMIPNVKDVYILSIDTEKKCVTVDWDADWR